MAIQNRPDNLKKCFAESVYGESRKKRDTNGEIQIPNQDQDMDIYINEGENNCSYGRNFCKTCYIQGFLETKLEGNYNAVMGLSSSDWGKHVQDVKTLPAIKLDGLCGFLCSLNSTCDRFVVDGPNCHTGQNATTDGSVTNTFDKVWTTWVKAG